MMDALRAAVVAGDAAGAAKQAHAIAGSAGNLGADALLAAARALERAGRERRADLSALFADVEDRAATVLRTIERLRPGQEHEARSRGTAIREFDRAGAEGALDRLGAALDVYDFSSASAAVADLATAGLPAWAADDLHRLEHCVDAYEYADACGIASRLLTRLRAANDVDAKTAANADPARGGR